MTPTDPEGGATRRCTGPRTPEGKAKASMNALKHGLTARTPLLPGEDEAEFEQFVAAVIEDLAADGPVQRELAQRAAVLMWKRRRIDEAEREVFDELAGHYAEDAEDVLLEMEEFAETDADHAKAAAARVEDEAIGAERDTRYMLADELASEPGEKVGRFERRRAGKLDRLARHEQRINQQIDSTIHLLLKLQNRRQWQEQTRKRQDPGTDAGTREGPTREEAATGKAEAKTTRAVDVAGEPMEPPRVAVPPPLPLAQNELPAGNTGEPGTGPPGAIGPRPGLN